MFIDYHILAVSQALSQKICKILPLTVQKRLGCVGSLFTTSALFKELHIPKKRYYIKADLRKA